MFRLRATWTTGWPWLDSLRWSTRHAPMRGRLCRAEAGLAAASNQPVRHEHPTAWYAFRDPSGALKIALLARSRIRWLFAAIHTWLDPAIHTECHFVITLDFTLRAQCTFFSRLHWATWHWLMPIVMRNSCDRTSFASFVQTRLASAALLCAQLQLQIGRLQSAPHSAF